VLMAEHDVPLALAALRRAFKLWQELGAPYEMARVRERLGLALERNQDSEAARVELESARLAYESLGAARDAARAGERVRASRSGRDGPLSEREVQVVGLVAAGLTNRDIAGKLGISEKTVARHLNNIFNKLDLPSRSALTAYAFRHDLV